jgi:hypothetical protein
LYGARIAAWSAMDTTRGYAIGADNLAVALGLIHPIQERVYVDTELAQTLRVGALAELSECVRVGVPAVVVLVGDSGAKHYSAGVPEHDGFSINMETFYDTDTDAVEANFTVGINGDKEILADYMVRFAADDNLAPVATPAIKVYTGEEVTSYLSDECKTHLARIDMVSSGETTLSARQCAAERHYAQAELVDALTAVRDLGINIEDILSYTERIDASDAVCERLLYGSVQIGYEQDEQHESMNIIASVLELIWPYGRQDQDTDTLPGFIINKSQQMFAVEGEAGYNRESIVRLFVERYGMDSIEAINRLP